MIWSLRASFGSITDSPKASAATLGEARLSDRPIASSACAAYDLSVRRAAPPFTAVTPDTGHGVTRTPPADLHGAASMGHHA
ncbi:hypothetical protein Adi01nite_63970 [Amorphoplanes digitatis]|nr:hypothetical protein Adi01nite_63970 [Actinoplanes digitatis]